MNKPSHSNINVPSGGWRTFVRQAGLACTLCGGMAILALCAGLSQADGFVQCIFDVVDEDGKRLSGASISLKPAKGSIGRFHETSAVTGDTGYGFLSAAYWPYPFLKGPICELTVSKPGFVTTVIQFKKSFEGEVILKHVDETE